MKLAIPYENGQVFPHFGKTQQFKIYDIADGKVGASLVVPVMGGGHGALAGFLRMLGISVVLVGGIGPGALDALARYDITPIPGVSGDADKAAADFVAGKLSPDTAALCQHHHEGNPFGCGHHTCGEGHDCGGEK